jgi:hypothetical protein
MLRPCRFPYAFPDTRVRLAIQVHSLARFSKRTTEHRLAVGPTAGSPPARSPQRLSCPVARSPTEFKPYCTSLLGVLFSVRSRYLFTIGFEMCLVLAVDAGHVHEGYPTPDTLELTHTVLTCVTGFSPCLTLHSRRLHTDDPVMRVSPNTTLLLANQKLRFGLCRVHSPLVTTSRSVSLPAGTEMFQFPAFPIARSNCGGDSHSEILSSSPPCGSLRLIAAWHVLRRHSNRAIHQLA